LALKEIKMNVARDLDGDVHHSGVSVPAAITFSRKGGREEVILDNDAEVVIIPGRCHLA